MTHNNSLFPNPQVPMDPRAWIRIQHEYNNGVKIGIIIPFALKERSLFWTPFWCQVWKLRKLLSITLSSKNIILSNIGTNSKNQHQQSVARSTRDATSERPKTCKEKTQRNFLIREGAWGWDLWAATYLLTYLG